MKIRAFIQQKQGEFRSLGCHGIVNHGIIVFVENLCLAVRIKNGYQKRKYKHEDQDYGTDNSQTVVDETFEYQLSRA